MKNKFSSIWHLALALILVLGFSLVPVIPAMAAPGHRLPRPRKGMSRFSTEVGRRAASTRFGRTPDPTPTQHRHQSCLRKSGGPFGGTPEKGLGAWHFGATWRCSRLSPRNSLQSTEARQPCRSIDLR